MTLKAASQAWQGFGCAVSAYLIWGMSPLYWKTLAGVPAIEILMHRVVWSFLFLIPFVLLNNCGDELKAVFKSPRTLLILVITTLLVATNWLVFIWAVNHDHVLQTSLGYYINPLLSIVLGMVFLKERLRPLQLLAVVLAASGVLYRTLELGVFPWIALTVATSFGLYGLVRKIASVTPLVGLWIETLILTPPALAYLIYVGETGSGAFSFIDPRIDLLLSASALVTALPLLLFNLGAKRLHLSTVGFLQYITPSCFFLFAVFVFYEPFSTAQVWTFVLIWTALAICSADSMLFHRLRRKRARIGLPAEKV